MEDIRKLLFEEAEKISISLSDEQLLKFQKYLELLVETNEKVNLTAITEPKEVVMKHFIDSIALFSVCDVKENAKVADVGTGAGFPGVPLKITRDDIDLTLIDSLNKRLVFLDTLCNEIYIKVKLVHMRAEECGKNKDFREKFDVVTARAVAALNTLCEYCLPLVKVGGKFIAMKSLKTDEEVKNAKKAIELLGGKIEKIEEISLSEDMTRTFVVIKKVKNTPPKYPRLGAKISKNPIV